MKSWLALVALFAFALSGCIDGGEDSDDDSDDIVTPEPDPEPELPEEISDSKEVTGGMDPFNFAMMGVCSQDVSSCFEYPFTTNATVNVDATLTWTVPASDFDLYLYKGETEVDSSGNTPPGTEEALSTEIDAGDYRLIVVAWAVTQDTYTIDATFDAA